MSSRRGKIYNDDRFGDDTYEYDQEFGRNSLDKSTSLNRSHTTHYKDHRDRAISEEDSFEDRETSFQRSKTIVKSSPSRKLEGKKVPKKEKKQSRAGVDLGRQLKPDLRLAAELKLGTKIYKGNSLLEFWKTHIKRKPLKLDELALMQQNKSMMMSASLNKSTRSMKPPTAPTEEDMKNRPIKYIPAESKAGDGKSKKNGKIDQLVQVYDRWESAKIVDVKHTLKLEDKLDEDNKAIAEDQAKGKAKKAEAEHAEREVKREISDYFTKYKNREMRNEVADLRIKSEKIEELRQKRESQKGRSKSKSRKREASTDEARSKNKRRGQKSPIKIDGSLDDIEESKLSVSLPKSSKKSKKSKKEDIDNDDDHKFTEEEIDNFDYDRERDKLHGTLDVLFTVYINAVFNSRSSSYKFTNNPELLLKVFKEKQTGKRIAELSNILSEYNRRADNVDSKDKKAKDYKNEALSIIEKSLVNYFKSDQDFMARILVNYEKDVATQLRSNDKVLDYYNSIPQEIQLRRGIYRHDADKVINDWVKDENTKIEAQQKALERLEKIKRKFLEKQSDKVKKDFKNPDVKAVPLSELAKPKDKWKRGRKLLELQKLFPHDLVLQRLVKDEFKENRVFKYPEEYEVYDDTEETKRKMPKYKVMTVTEKEDHFKDVEERQQMALEKFLVKENIRQDQIKFRSDQQKQQGKQFKAAFEKEIDKYIDEIKNRLHQKREKSQRETLSEIYNRLKSEFPQIMEEKFPHITYGMNKDTETYKKAFPQQFKYEFYKQFNIRKKRGKATSSRAAYFVPSGTNHTSYNAKIQLGEDLMKKYEKPQPGIKTRVWKRDDYLDIKQEIMMSKDDAKNCTFEPNAGSQNPTMKKVLSTFPELERDDYRKERTLKEYVDKFGDKFANSNPEIYKQGILRAAQGHFNSGNIDDSWKKLREGFNVESIKRYMDPKYAKKLEIKKKKLEKKKKLIAEGKLKEDIKDNLEIPGEQKNLREEKFEVAKMIPILEETFGLICKLEDYEENHVKQKQKFKDLIKLKMVSQKMQIKKKDEEIKKKIAEKRSKKAEEEKKYAEIKKKAEEEQVKKEEKRKKEEKLRLVDFIKRNDKEKGLDTKKKKRPQSNYNRKALNKDLKGH